ncbi:enoyl-CoA hydratase/isomerase family protein [Parvularcula maris]|uniref:Enoyl-CoA hydratase/isomerase family protein n=1 Tax=Parvularcula maris TaxID=2965077 RepID=A0A9X2L7S1_9PROT|nr:enoyl-CoA hydratase/isomerase family protein [Parvularcula maris]MCQ8184656.1 enoyl-CoA hydratase/isomerase family protein [Parvularcula maris]
MTALTQHDLLHTDLDDGWLRLTMDDPEKRNALSTEMAGALLETLTAVRDDRSVRGITLQGSNRIFCSGGDLKGMAGHIMGGDRETIRTMSEVGGRLFAAFASQPQVTLVLIDGSAMAGGLGLACCADFVAVTPAAKFAFTEVRLGIPPAQIAPFVVRRVGLVAAKKLMLTGSSFGGEKAAEIGLADALVADGEALEAYEQALAEQVRGCAPGAVAATKELAIRAAEHPPHTLAEEAAQVFTDCLLSDEGREGIASFAQKRKPSWAPHD